MHREIYNTFCERIQAGNEENNLGMHRSMSGIDYTQFCTYIFVNWTPRSRSLKLNKIGSVILCKLYQYWSFDLSLTDHMLLTSGRGQLFLQRHLKSPFYHDHKVLHIFNREAALEIEVASRDMQLWIDMFEPSAT